MLSYMLPVEEKSPAARNLSLNLTNSNHTSDTSGHTTDDVMDDIDENTKLLISERGGNNGCLTAKESLNNNVTTVNKNHPHYIHPQTNGVIKTNGDIKENGAADGNISKKGKLTKVGNKNVTLKRVSFGSSKGSMVETLVFETPTPLPEHSEREFFSSIQTNSHGHGLYHHQNGGTNGLSNGCVNNNGSAVIGLDDSGIELQEESERSKVRVTFFQSSKPQQISPPSLEFNNHFNNHSNQLIYFGDNNNLIDTSLTTSYILNNNNFFNNNINNNNCDWNNDLIGLGGGTTTTTMAATATMTNGVAYDRQMSTESGWDNPFRPGGDLSREADEIVNMIKGGKPITPTGDHQLENGQTPKDSHGNENGHTVVDGVTKLDASQLQSTQKNGTKSPQKSVASPLKNGNGATNTTTTAVATNNNQISNQVVPGPQSVSHVVIDEKKKKKCHCCVIQ